MRRLRQNLRGPSEQLDLGRRPSGDSRTEPQPVIGLDEQAGELQLAAERTDDVFVVEAEFDGGGNGLIKRDGSARIRRCVSFLPAEPDADPERNLRQWRKAPHPERRFRRNGLVSVSPSEAERDSTIGLAYFDEPPAKPLGGVCYGRLQLRSHGSSASGSQRRKLECCLSHRACSCVTALRSFSTGAETLMGPSANVAGDIYVSGASASI